MKLKHLILATTSIFLFSISSFGQWSTSGNPNSSSLKLGGTTAGHNVNFITDDLTRMTLTANGWLGLGTTSPRAVQEIIYKPGQGQHDNGLVVTLNRTTGGIYTQAPYDVIGRGLVEYSPNEPGSVVHFAPFSFQTGNVTTLSMPLYSAAKPMFWVRAQTDHSQTSLTGEEEFDTKFIVMPDGSCGVNITNPRAALDVRGSQAPNRPAAIFGSRAIGTNNTNNSFGLNQYYTQQVQFVPNLKENGYNQIVKAGDQGMFFSDGQGLEGSNSNGSFVLAPWSESGNPSIGGLRIDANGNTECHGTFRATEVKINPQWWSDFVFADDYKLMSLNEVESFIKKNKHLPNIPSENEVLENGIDVANMQALQQQKIEELTLYLIDLKKEIESLKS
jgi:hypothetical protein